MNFLRYWIFVELAFVVSVLFFTLMRLRRRPMEQAKPGRGPVPGKWFGRVNQVSFAPRRFFVELGYELLVRRVHFLNHPVELFDLCLGWGWLNGSRTLLGHPHCGKSY